MCGLALLCDEIAARLGDYPHGRSLCEAQDLSKDQPLSFPLVTRQTLRPSQFFCRET